MSQICLRNISYHHSGPPLVTMGNAVINQGDRVAIIGRNGAGKSTLLKLLIDDSMLDEGAIEKSSNCRVAMLTQTLPDNINETVYAVIESGLSQLDLEPWDIQHRVEAKLSQFQLNGESLFSALSGGLQRQVLLAKSIIADPDVLLLDEPTNHLDISAILRLENFLKNYNKTIIFITHDRNLMQKIATKIINIDNRQLISWIGTYYDFLRHKETLIAAEERANALFDKRLSQEEVWIRQGIKARRTRNEGRVRALKKMREEYASRQKRVGTVQLSQQIMQASGKQVFEIDDVSFSYADKTIIKSFSSLIVRGDKIGIIGDNGSGKSTLINLLLGNIQPTLGKIKQGSNLEIAYFDQRHKELVPNKTLAENVAGGSDHVMIGKQSKHVISYLQDFLFSPEAARSPIKNLSGGERNRALLAKLFLIPSNVLILDEPTNDLDIETLELLEERLSEYEGTLILVSHDREFLNNLVTYTYVLPGDGSVRKYNGGYDDYLQESGFKEAKNPVPRTDIKPVKNTHVDGAKQKAKALEKILKEIAQLEKEQADLYAQMAQTDFYQQSSENIAKIQKQAEITEKKLAEAYTLWQELES